MRLKKFLVIPVIILLAIVCFGQIKSQFSTDAAAVEINTDSTANIAAPDEGYKAAVPGAEAEPSGNPALKLPESLWAGKDAGSGQTAADKPVLEIYKGPVRHIFFHPLIIYPERAFVGGSLSKGFNDWFVTVSEFRPIIESIYENDYILVSMDSVCSVEERDGVRTVKRGELLLPKGKKPLVISIDDMNYYEYMRESGCADRLYFDEQGHTAVESVGRDGVLRQSCEDIVPIVDEFVRQHPGFSLNGAKGIIALTGYEGILGYRTDKIDSPEYEDDKALAVSTVSRLKDEGWSFACHGYGHLDAAKVSTERLKKDCKRWMEEVEPLIGRTPVYIYPYGSSLKYSDEKFELLKDNGFSIFCGVGPDGDIELKGDFAYLERKSVDGVSIYKNSRYLKDLFDCGKVLDPARPEEY